MNITRGKKATAALFVMLAIAILAVGGLFYVNNASSAQTGLVVASCTDSDGGIKIYTKGFTKGVSYTGGGYTDTCGRQYGSTPSTALREFYCKTASTVGSQDFQCPNGCSSGACIAASTPVPTPTPAPVTCADSDGGQVYDVKGTTSLSSGSKMTDYCNYGTTVAVCSGSGCFLNEHYCAGDKIGQKSDVVCPNGCKDGACVKALPSCEDSDNGKNYFVKGTASGDLTALGHQNVVGRATDFCVQLKDGKYPWVYDPNWQGQVLNNPVIASCESDCAVYEMYCSAQGQVLGDAPKCPGGCKDGACLPAPAPTCTDSDGGSNYAVPGSVVYTNNPDGVAAEYDICDVGNVLAERVCKSQTDHMQNFERYTCPNGCKDGACLPAPTQDCSDTDGGWTLNMNGIAVVGGKEVCSDRCATPDELQNSGGKDQLFECFCGNKQGSGGGQGSGWTSCPAGTSCSNGACTAAPAHQIV